MRYKLTFTVLHGRQAAEFAGSNVQIPEANVIQLNCPFNLGQGGVYLRMHCNLACRGLVSGSGNTQLNQAWPRLLFLGKNSFHVKDQDISREGRHVIIVLGR